MFQSSSFQSYGFQGVVAGGQPDTDTVGDSRSHYQKFQDAERQREKLRKEKTEAQKLQSVINEYERRKSITDESLLIAEESERARLLAAQNELITEINRLLIVKAEMMARIKRSEELLILTLVMRRKRFRVLT